MKVFTRSSARHCETATQPDLRQPYRWVVDHIAAVCMTMLLTLLLSSCGFHLRGSIAIPESLSPVFVQDNGGTQVKPVLLQLLHTNHVSLATKPAEAKSLVVIHGEQFQRRVSSVAGSGKVQEFELQYLLQYSILDAENQPVLAQQSLRLTRDLRFDENAVLAKAQEEAQRNKDMVIDAAQQLLRRLQSIGVEKSMQTSEHKAP